MRPRAGRSQGPPALPAPAEVGARPRSPLPRCWRPGRSFPVPTRSKPGTFGLMGDEGTATGASTLTEVIDRFETQGYDAQFGAREGAQIRCFACRATFPAEDAGIDAMERLEGAS